MADKETQQPTLLERLSKVQTELKAPKSQRNTFGNYNYRNVEDILEAVKPLLAAHGLNLTISDTIELIGDRYYVKASAEITDSTSPKANFTVTAYAREEETKKGMDGSQITGASSSYARKYALNGLFLIDDTKDSDATNDHGKGKDTTSAPAKPYTAPTQPTTQDSDPFLPEDSITPSQAQELMQLAKAKGYTDRPKAIEFLNTQSGLDDFTKLPRSQYDAVKTVVIKSGWSK